MQVEISEDGFINMLRNQNGGALAEELDKELISGIGSILDFGGESKITVTFKIRRIKEFDEAVQIEHDVTVNHPKEKRPKKAMFITTGNGLKDQPQDQESLDLGQPVIGKPNPLKANISTIGK